ncbi:hypothetical protein [Thalassotalea sp. PP2-459]|uniref:hypothetical protein n=1 Tax=Thalassotalea sp. PP2-459 TaxID=1742724 RepID=UPI0009451608|nr:hypothetical protein [Thalassotalea sp. PP2-459]OKY25077.1 hypothetical protein BI291_03415 [Thalassotalea sp. PP2-459]
MKYFVSRRHFARGTQTISVQKNKKIVYSTNVVSFLREHKASIPEISSRMAPYDPDGSLSCDWDPDFTCEEWNQSDAVRDLVNVMENSVMTFTVTQAYFDANDSAQKKMNFIYSLLLAIPVSRYAELATALTKNAISNKINILISTGVGWVLADLITSLMDSDLKLGDQVTITGGVITVESSGGSGGGGYEDDEYVDGDSGDLTLVCNTFSTNTGTGTPYIVQYKTCYFS